DRDRDGHGTRGYPAKRLGPALVLVVVVVVVRVHDLAAAVRAARRADAVRQARAVARRARGVRRRRDLGLGAALGGARARLLLLRDGHERPRRVADRRGRGRIARLASLPACPTSTSARCETRTSSTPTACASTCSTRPSRANPRRPAPRASTPASATC